MFIGVICAESAFADSRPVQVALGTREQTFSGSIHGFEVASFRLDARAGQSLRYEFSGSDRNVYANIWGPDATEALWVGTKGSDDASVLVLESGAHQIDVYQSVKAARAGDTVSFTLNISVSDPPEADPLTTHALQGAPRTEALAEQRTRAPLTDSQLGQDAASVEIEIASLRDAEDRPEFARAGAPAEQAQAGMPRPQLRPSLARVTGVSTSLNLRDAPSREAEVVSTLSDGEDVLLREWTTLREHQWCNVDTGGHSGWVVAQFLTTNLGRSFANMRGVATLSTGSPP